MESAAGSSSTTAESRGIDNRCFEHVELKGRNVGASMSFLPGSSLELKNSLCINIYVNSNVQGVNNSLVMGSEVKMRDGGVRIHLHGLNKRLKKHSKKKKNRIHVPAAVTGFLCMLVLSFFAFLLFLSLE